MQSEKSKTPTTNTTDRPTHQPTRPTNQILEKRKQKKTTTTTENTACNKNRYKLNGDTCANTDSVSGRKNLYSYKRTDMARQIEHTHTQRQTEG